MNCKFIIAKIFSRRAVRFYSNYPTTHPIATCICSAIIMTKFSSFCSLIIFNSSKYLHSFPSFILFLSIPCLLCNIHASGRNFLLLFYKLLILYNKAFSGGWMSTEGGLSFKTFYFYDDLRNLEIL